MRFQWSLILIAISLCRYGSCDNAWWPFTWLKIGMQPHRLPSETRKSPSPELPYSINERPRNVENFLQYQSHLRHQHQLNRALPPVHFARSFVPHLWTSIGDSGTTDEKSNRNVRKIEPETSDPQVLAPAAPASPVAFVNPSIDCSHMLSTAAPHSKPAGLTEVRSSTVAKDCAPGDNCRIYLRSFQTGDSLFQYAYSHSTALEPILQNIYESTRGSAFAPPLSSNSTVAPEVVKLSMGLVKALRANRVLIIGVFTGLSVVGAALSVEYGGQVVGVEDPRYVKYWHSIGSKYAFEAGLGKTIVMQSSGLVNEYLEHLAKAQPNTFDFVFLDDTDMENYEKDYEQAIKLLRPRGIMLINDVFVDGSVLSGLRYRDKATETVTILNRKLRDDHRIENAVMLPFGGGVMMLVKK